jgi:protein CpxP
MKKSIRPFILCTFLAATALLAAPQQPRDESVPMQHNGSALRQRLALTRDQQIQIRAINRDRKAQFAAVQSDSSLSPSDRKQKNKAIHRDAETKIRAILTEDQRAEYDQIKREHREQTLRNRETALPPQ